MSIFLDRSIPAPAPVVVNYNHVLDLLVIEYNYLSESGDRRCYSGLAYTSFGLCRAFCPSSVVCPDGVARCFNFGVSLDSQLDLLDGSASIDSVVCCGYVLDLSGVSLQQIRREE